MHLAPTFYIILYYTLGMAFIYKYDYKYKMNVFELDNENRYAPNE